MKLKYKVGDKFILKTNHPRYLNTKACMSSFPLDVVEITDVDTTRHCMYTRALFKWLPWKYLRHVLDCPLVYHTTRYPYRVFCIEEAYNKDMQKVKDAIDDAHYDWCNCNKDTCDWREYFYKKLGLDK